MDEIGRALAAYAREASEVAGSPGSTEATFYPALQRLLSAENIGYQVERLALLEIELAPLGRHESRVRGVYGVPRIQFRSVAVQEE